MVYLNDKLFTSGRDGLKVFNLDGGKLVFKILFYFKSIYKMNLYLNCILILKLFKECLHEGNNNHKFVRDDILG